MKYTGPMRALNVLFLVAFLASAAVQLNDPDPARWIALYLAAAGACGLRLAGKPWRLPAGVVLAVAGGWGATLAGELWGQPVDAHALTDWQMKAGGSEELREAGGLFLVSVWMFVLVLMAGVGPTPADGSGGEEAA